MTLRAAPTLPPTQHDHRARRAKSSDSQGASYAGLAVVKQVRKALSTASLEWRRSRLVGPHGPAPGSAEAVTLKLNRTGVSGDSSP